MPTIHLRNNAAVRLRSAHGRDHERLRRMFYTLSDDTRYRYFGVGAPATADWAERLAALGRPAPDAYALVAETRGGVIGVARYVADEAGRYAEIGIVVADGWQSLGLGTQLLYRLGDVACGDALAGFTGYVIGENRRALGLVRRVFDSARITWVGGAFDVFMPFTSHC